MTRTALPWIVGLLLVARAAALELATTPWPPFTGQGAQPGVAIDLVHNALGRIGIRATTRVLPEGELNAALAAGRYDGSPAMWKSPDRERDLLFSHPILENRLVLVGRRGTDVSASSLGELAGQRVGLVSGYAYGPDLPEGPEYVLGESPQANLDALRAGEVDYVLADDLLVRYLARHQPDRTQLFLAIGTRAMLTRSLHFALRRGVPKAATTMVQFNAVLRKMLADGEYHRILGFRWIRADVDGDGQLELVADGLKAGREPPTRAYAVDSDDRLERAKHGSDRYAIGGQVFDSWKAIPDSFKVPVPSKRDLVPESGTFYEF